MLKKPGMRLFIGMLIGLLAGACMLADDEQKPPPKPEGVVSIDVHARSLPEEPPVRAPDPEEYHPGRGPSPEHAGTPQADPLN